MLHPIWTLTILMKIKIILFLILSIFAGEAFSQSIVITPKTVVHKRTGKVAGDWKRTFDARYPTVGPGVPAATRRQILSNLDYWRAFSWSGNKFSLRDELRDGGWVDNLDYEVKYNANNILDVWLTMEGSGAYPDSSTKYIVLDSRSGKKLKLADLFRKDRFTQLRNSIRQIMRNDESRLESDEKDELRSERENGNYSEFHPTPEKLQLKDLDGFSISKNGVTFLYDYGYAHVVQALEPPGNFFLSYKELKPFIRRDGLLGRFVN